MNDQATQSWQATIAIEPGELESLLGFAQRHLEAAARSATALHLVLPVPAVADFDSRDLLRLDPSANPSLEPVPAPSAPDVAATKPLPTLETCEGRFEWQARDGHSVSAAGIVKKLEANGTPRFSAIQLQAETLWQSLRVVTHPRAPGVAPRLFGGFSFAPGTCTSSPWQDFGDAVFVLPKWCYGRVGAAAWLSLTLPLTAVSAGSEPARQPLTALRRILVALGRRSSTTFGSAQHLAALAQPRSTHAFALPRPQSASPTVEHLSLAAWSTMLDTARRDLDEGHLLKVVAARCTRVRTTENIDPRALLQRLAQRFEDCGRFAFHFNASAFLGATPEQLIRRHGLHIRTDAMAGSAPIEAAAELSKRPKEQREHALVSDTLLAKLRPLCSELKHPTEPQLRRLRNIVHLHTPIEGKLRHPQHVLQLVAALHPSPAVGGLPVDAAVAWIAANEAQPRGWYAGPVGWFDANGDGDFMVALRSALIRSRDAYLYAGAGLVSGFDVGLEYRETELKMHAMLDALLQP